MALEAKVLPVERVINGFRRRWLQWRNNQRISSLADQVKKAAPKEMSLETVVFFNASTRLGGTSLNAAFSLLTSWALRLEGVNVVHFACYCGLSPCVLGTNRNNVHAAPPCRECLEQSAAVYSRAVTTWFQFQVDPDVAEQIKTLDLEALTVFEYQGVPLGKLVLPSMRWILRKHHLEDDENMRFLFRQYILSAWHGSREFAELLDETRPKAVVVFNGMFYPEAVARWVAMQRGIKVISHEVGLRSNTGYFTTGEATAYPIHIPDSFELSPEQENKLDAYLEQRFQGNFSMAGVRFWKQMDDLDEKLLERINRYSQLVPVFTNVVFDTSQGHANIVFDNMFAWLDLVLKTIRKNPQTLFVIRAHPDECRPGKESLESVAEWVKRNQVDTLDNVVFVDAHESVSSYELIRRSKFVMVYNSTIGLEASLMGAAVLCGGKARFTQLAMSFFPSSPEEFEKTAADLLAGANVNVPPEFQRNARRFLYYQLFKTSLPFEQFIEEDGIWKGYVKFKPFHVDMLRPDYSPSMRAIIDGITRDGDFYLSD